MMHNISLGTKMREIKFRGKAFNVNGIECLPKWVYGNLIISDNGDCFITQWTRSSGVGYESVTYQVDPKSVGQYTGLKDCNGKEIYDGDIYKEWQGNIRIVVWKDFFWVFELPEKQRKELGHRYEDFHNVGEVIGNIYENLDLLEEG